MRKPIEDECEKRFFLRSHVAWESNFAKVALKALAEAYFFFGGELVVFSRILIFFGSFRVLHQIFVVFAREVSQK